MKITDLNIDHDRVRIDIKFEFTEKPLSKQIEWFCILARNTITNSFGTEYPLLEDEVELQINEYCKRAKVKPIEASLHFASQQMGDSFQEGWAIEPKKAEIENLS